MRTATCSCGQLKAHCEGEPIRVSICHCLECQKRTGSIFAVQARFPTAAVRVEGEAREWQRVGDEGTRATFRFCATCSAIVYWTNDGMPDNIAVPVGAFADPSFPPPVIGVYTERRHAWAEMPGLKIEEYE